MSILDTKTCGYDQITVVTQRAINKQLEAYHAIANAEFEKNKTRVATGAKETQMQWPALARWKTTPLKCKSGEPDTWTGIDAKMDAPVVRLSVQANENTMVYWTLRLKTGSFRFQTVEGSAVKNVEIPIENWTYTFRTNLNFQAEDRDEAIEKARERLGKATLNDFSIQRLMLVITDTDILLPVKGELTKTADLSFDAQSTLSSFVTKYMMSQQGQEYSVLGYALTAKTTANAGAKSTITPTKLTFTNYAYMPAKDALNKDGASNMLVYLQMTGKETPWPVDGLEPSANWVPPPTSGSVAQDGTVCLSKKIFLDGWLLKRLKVFNQKTVAVPETYWKSRMIGIEYSFTTLMGVSHSNKANEAEKAGAWTFDSERFKTNTTELRYYYDYHEQADDNTSLWRTTMDSYTNNEILIPIGLAPGEKCIIKVKGKTMIKNYIFSNLVPTRSQYWLDWSFDIIFDGVAEGRLKIDARFPDNLAPSSSNDENFLDQGKLSQLDGDFADALTEIKSTLRKIERDLESVFDNNWSFVFGGRNVFFIDRCQFNKEGDLLADLKYK